MTVGMENSFGVRKDVKLGFSWTTFFFGFYVPFSRGDWKWTGIMIAVIIAITMIGLGSAFAFANGVFSVIYNKFYAQDLLEQGYRGINEEAHQAVINYVNNS